MAEMTLHALLSESARRFPDRVAVETADGDALRYVELDASSDLIRDQLVKAGVAPGDRVGLYLEKSLASVASLFAILKCGAAYVPVDPHAPAERNRYIFTNCSVRVVVTDARRAEMLRAPDKEGLHFQDIECHTPAPLKTTLSLMAGAVDCAQSPVNEPLAYILYTSGSTGRPKGVMHSHRTALSFVDWCSAEFAPTAEDRFSSHAPFHFDLSILDLFVSIKHGAAVVLIGEELGKQPMRLAPAIAEHRISVWYSTPSILRLLAEFGQLQSLDLSRLRLLLFAGEVFPMKHLKSLHSLLPHPRY